MQENYDILSKAKDVLVMIDFKSFDLNDKKKYNDYLLNCGERGCEYNLSNLFIWGRQKAACFPNGLAFFSHFNKNSVYLFPLYRDNPKEILDAIINDAHERGIDCCLTSLSKDDCALLEQLYPGKFQFHTDENNYDYIYSIENLAELKGRKYQRKRNHLNRFKVICSGYTVEPITDQNTLEIQMMLDDWYADHQEKHPNADICMEQVAIHKALRYRTALDMEGIIIRHNEKILAMTMGSRLSSHTFDVQFEKAADEAAYVAINYEFARYLRQKYPDLLWLNREDDLGLEGLRKAKLSYHPQHMVEKAWANLRETGYED